jgi:hypothetical protein
MNVRNIEPKIPNMGGTPLNSLLIMCLWWTLTKTYILFCGLTKTSMGIYSCFQLIRWKCLPNSTFVISLTHFDWPTTKKTLKAPLNRNFYWKMECISFGPPIQVKVGGLSAKCIGQKCGAIGDILGTHTTTYVCC